VRRCTVIGDAAGYTPPGAAMLNGTLAHSLDFDDTHAPGSLHPSAPIVPAAFAAAEMKGADGKSGDRGDRRGLRSADPAEPRARPCRPLRPRLPSDCDLRRIRRSRRRRTCARPGCGRTSPMRSASCSAWRRARCSSWSTARGPSARTSDTRRCAGSSPRRSRAGLQGRGRRDRRQVGIPACLCAQPRIAAQASPNSAALGDAEDRGEALSLVPLQPRRGRRHDSRSRASTAYGGRRRGGRGRTARAGLENHRRSRGRQAVAGRSSTGSSRWRSVLRSRCAQGAWWDDYARHLGDREHARAVQARAHASTIPRPRPIFRRR
jgi:hypothetical protein